MIIHKVLFQQQGLKENLVDCKTNNCFLVSLKPLLLGWPWNPYPLAICYWITTRLCYFYRRIEEWGVNLTIWSVSMNSIGLALTLITCWKKLLVWFTLRNCQFLSTRSTLWIGLQDCWEGKSRRVIVFFLMLTINFVSWKIQIYHHLSLFPSLFTNKPRP